MLKRAPKQCPWCAKNIETKAIGIEIQGLYDGVAFYLCPYCDQRVSRRGNRITEGEAHLFTRQDIFTK